LHLPKATWSRVLPGAILVRELRPWQLTQVGTDEKAQEFLSRLDNDSKVGKLVDCTSSFEQEQEEYLKKSGE
jgi:hypothetical protein